MKLVLEKVKIYGYNPAKFKEFTNTDKDTGAVTITKNYDVCLYISQEQRNLIDSYIYGKCDLTKDGENIFYGRSKQPIPVFDVQRNRIEGIIKDVFLADASILIDEFNDKKTGLPVRYSKCLGIKYLSKVEKETSKIYEEKTFETFDEIFGDETENKDIFKAVQVNKLPVDCSQETAAPGFSPVVNSTLENVPPPPVDDLPF